MATILVVDDRPLNREFLMTLFGYSGYRTLEARDGAEALKTAQAEHPDLIVTDILMPVMGGYELANRLRADPQLAGIPVVFYTATYRADEARALAESFGVAAVLSKPSDPERILATVQALLESAVTPPPPSFAEELEQAPAPAAEAVSRIGEQLAGYGRGVEMAHYLLALELEGAQTLLEKKGRRVSGRLSRAAERLQAVNLRLATLIELGLDLASQREPISLLDVFCRAAHDICAARFAAVGIVDDAGRALRYFRSKGYDEETLARMEPFPMSSGVLGQLLADRHPQRVGDGSLETLGLPPSHPPVRALLGVPIVSTARVYGWLYLAEKVGEAEFSEIDEDIAVTMAVQLAVAYENLVLYEDLSASQARFSGILDIAHEAIVSVDRSQRIILFNKGAERVFGYVAEEVLGRPLDMLVPELLRERHRQHLERYAAGSGVSRRMGETREVAGQHKNGRIFPAEISISRLENDGEIVLTAVLRDVTERKRAEQALSEREARFRAVAQSATDAFISADAEGNIVFWNDGARRMFGYAEEDILGKSLTRLIPERFQEPHRQGLRRVLAGGERHVIGRTVELAALRKDGAEFPIELSLAQWFHLDQVFFTAILRDISARKEQETGILRLNRIYALLSGINTAIVHIRDRQVLYEELCRIALEHGGFRAAWIGEVEEEGAGGLRPVAWGGVDRECLDAIAAGLCGEGALNPLLQVLRDGKSFISNDITADPLLEHCRDEAERRDWRAVAAFPFLTTAGGVEGVAVLYAGEAGFFDEAEVRLLKEMSGDVGYALENIKKEKQLAYLVCYDALTGLANRAHFIAALSDSLAWARNQGRKTALVVLDIDRFQLINDSLGYSVGDALLQQVGGRLKTALGKDGLLARSSSDEFAVAISRLDDEADLSRFVTETVLASLALPFDLGGRNLRITISAGAAVFPEDGDDAETLFKNAEAAVAKARQSKEKFLFYAQDMNARVCEILNVENKLRKALENGDFLLHYQPKLNLKASRLCGMEALLRWQDPENGLVSPARFIPILEETGMIVEVGLWVLNAAANQQREWQRKGFATVPVAVNVSCLQLQDAGFVAKVEEVLKRHELKADAIELEVTESVIMESAQQSIAMLGSLQSLGLNSAIDDFGTGYSSLSYLIRLPITHVKIDRAFIVNMAESPDDLAIVSSVITLAHGLNLNVIAEGVETEEQIKLLKLLKCDEAQGYIYSRPLPAAEIEALLAPVVDAER